MSDEISREDLMPRLKVLVVVQGFLGAGMLICGILGQQFAKGSEQLYFVGGYIVGITNLLAVLPATYIIMKDGDSDMSESKKRKVGCAWTAHVSIFLCTNSAFLFGLFFSTSFFTIDGDDYGKKVSDTNMKNRQMGHVLIAGCVASLLATLYFCYIHFFYPLCKTIARKRRSHMVVLLDSSTLRNQSSGGFSNKNTFGSQNAAQMEELKTQNLLSQQKMSLQQQQLLMQHKQQGFSGGSNLPPPPSYASVLSDPTYPPPNPTFPSAPYK